MMSPASRIADGQMLRPAMYVTLRSRAYVHVHGWMWVSSPACESRVYVTTAGVR